MTQPDQATAPEPDPAGTVVEAAQQRRPIVERLGLLAIALVFLTLFAIVGLAAFAGGEPFLGAMGLLGALMVAWAGVRSLLG